MSTHLLSCQPSSGPRPRLPSQAMGGGSQESGPVWAPASGKVNSGRLLAANVYRLACGAVQNFHLAPLGPTRSFPLLSSALGGTKVLVSPPHAPSSRHLVRGWNCSVLQRGLHHTLTGRGGDHPCACEKVSTSADQSVVSRPLLVTLELHTRSSEHSIA